MYLHRHISVNNTTIQPFDFKSELVMEAYLIENESVLALNKNFNEVIIVESEVPLLKGRFDKDTDGRIDILAKYGQEYLAIVELKKGELNEQHLTQLESYLKERLQILDKFKGENAIWDNSLNNEPKWIGIMVGEAISSELAIKITNGYLFNDEIPIAALTLKRYRGDDGNVYIITDTFFTSKGNKDYTQYIFNGNTYGKGRLVLAVIKEHINRNPDITFSQLASVFPNSLQGKETFTDYNSAENTYNNTGRKRHFIQPNELITLKDNSTIAVSREWGASNIERFIKHAISLGHNISSQ